MRSDEALIEQLRGGDLGAFDALYARYEAHLFGFIRAHLGDSAEAEDVLHEAFMAVLKGRDRPSSVRAWLFQVARNACLNRLRSRKRATTALEQVAEPTPAEPSADAQLEAHEATKALSEAVAKLPEGLAQLYHLRAQGLSYAELAEVLDVPLGTVKSRLHEVVQRLKSEVTS
jgi:RNA polymerase sigma-70 factor (ECF subfamily)